MAVPRGHLLTAAVLMFALCVLLLVCSSCATSGQARNVYIGLSAADVATTQYGINHGYSEGNPVYGNSHPAVKAAVVSALFLWAFDKIMSDMPEDQKRYAWEWLAVARAIPVVWNIYELHTSAPVPPCQARKP